MIRVIAVDDEKPALRRLGKLLEAFDRVEVCGLYDSPKKFLEFALTSPESFDLALLDMEMPGLHGLELARRLRGIRPEVNIVFITAYEEFARDAFDVEALDYLLKPMTEEHLARTLSRCEKRIGHSGAAEAAGARSVSVRSFGPFSVITGQDAPIRFRNSKSRELLAYLHEHGGKPVGKASIMEELWPGGDEERSQVNLHTTVYQLRKDLEAFGLVDVIEQAKTAGGSYGLRWPGPIDDDAAEFELAFREYRRTSSLTPVLRAIRLYGDGYLAGSGYGWAAPRQAELEMKFSELLEAMIDAYVRSGRYDIALGPMQKAVRLQPLEERLHAKMIALLLLMGREEDAKRYDAMIQDLLEERESDEPSVLDFSRLSANPASYF
ncbi:response regulator [Paenibacillus antri]|uniref:Response regulator n=1 Tax=Paenibacillus antri TaxID=2582848 RepID=A0A5R9GKF7_9BACL|nr:response regulator [Paenibacillus antri]TLS52165.1 response regulator [Paenibacillus antri]